MLNILDKVFMIVVGGELMVGIVGNGFVGLTNCLAWIRHQKLYLVDFILTTLACVRIIQMLLTVFDFCNLVSSQEVHDSLERNLLLASTWILTNHLNTWLAASLAVFYLLKIASFPHPLFLWLRWRINKVIFAVLLGSVPFLLMSFPLPYGFDVFWHYVQINDSGNMTGTANVSKVDNFNYMIVFTSIPPLSLSSISFALLLLSLRKHTKHLGNNVRGSRDPSMEAHFRAMRTVLSFLILYALHHFAIGLTFGAHYLIHSKLAVMSSYLLGLVYPSGHSYVVIFGNSHMKTAFLEMLWRLKHGLKRNVFPAA